MDLENQARIKQLAELYGKENLAVVIGAGDPDSAELVAQTVTTGDPSYAGPLTGVSLGLPVFHILEPEVKRQLPSDVYDDQVGLMEMALAVDGICEAVKRVREQS